MRHPASWLLAAALPYLGACGGGGSPTAPPAATPAPAASPTPSPAGSLVLRVASIRGVNGHGASGTAHIAREGDAYFLELRDDFRIDSGNNDVMLTRGSGTRTDADLNLGNMKMLTGAQRYPLPDDGSSYGYVMLWCRPFRVPIGLGELR